MSREVQKGREGQFFLKKNKSFTSVLAAVIKSNTGASLFKASHL